LTFNSYRRENSLKNRYLFNKGSELQDDLDLNFYHTKYRTYDQALGRFLQIDPKVDEFYSWTPYNFGYDNPVRYNDPDGDCPKCKEWLNAVKSWLNAPISKDGQAMGQGLMQSSTGTDVRPTKRWQLMLAIAGQAGSRYGGSSPGSLKIKIPSTPRPSKPIPSAKQLAQDHATQLRQAGGKLPTMAGSAVDRTTGQSSTQTSGKDAIVLVSPLKEQAPNPSLEPWNPCNCAETKAVNQLVSEGSAMENIDYHAVRVKNGDSEPPCKNCQQTLSGATHVE